MELRKLTIKSIKLAIEKYIPYLKNLRRNHLFENDILEEIDDFLDMYNEISDEIDKHNLHMDDLNKNYDDEPRTIKINIEEKHIKHLTSLVLRLLSDLKKEKKKIEKKEYLSKTNKEKLIKIDKNIEILEYQFKSKSTLFHKNKDIWPIKFPVEDYNRNKDKEKDNKQDGAIIFPLELIKKISPDIQILCEEFNFNYMHKKNYSCILLLRRILPLSIVRFFQSNNKENVIKQNWEFLDTKWLLWKIENKLTERRVYKEIINYKLIIDSSQHSYKLKISREDVQWASIVIRTFLDNIFHDL